MNQPKPLIFNIKGQAMDDGPGIRTTVFFKGCQLRCRWCQNPESIEAGVEIGFYAADCIRCGDCVSACRQGAISLDDPDRIDRRRCDHCGDCVAACPGRGLRRIGEYYPVEALLERVMRGRVFFEVSGGGVTLSGGEPTIHLDYLALLLKGLKQEGIHTAMQTNGFFRWREFAGKVLDYLDLIMVDVKLYDPQEHLEHTGQSNEVILENLARLLKARPQAVLPRVPLIPGLTATAHNLKAISRLFQEMGVSRCSLLPYNPTGFAKAGHLGRQVAADLPRHCLTPAAEQQCREMFSWAELVD
jgi:pyruvate formate lyase activating enzyme